MRILFISRAYGENAGGMERLSYELISSFERISPPYQGGVRGGLVFEKIVNETRPDRSLLATRLHSIIFAITIIPRSLVRARHANVVHIGDPVLLFLAWCIKVIYHKPVICTVHGLDLTFSNSIYQTYLKLFLPSCTEFIAISDYAKKILQQKNVTQKITVIPPGITDRNYDQSITRKDLEKILNQNLDNKIIFATTGRLVQRKGHAWFIENVLPRLPENVLYVIAGDGPERENISNIIVKNNLQSRVIMLGRISDADQKVLLNTCDAFIQPNISIPNDHEGFGIAPLEAALCARNVFASNIDGIPSAIISGKNGTLLPAEDPKTWNQALTEYSKHPSNNIQAREYTRKEFNWDVIAEKYREVFEKYSL
ncbi:MAG TPA: glycosyltransferase family 4 protein [Candidatus Andersenbacteria bacterium]|nr:glycosyltransferase family 4 protein [Candidatus Andersenbacteria bacterium]